MLGYDDFVTLMFHLGFVVGPTTIRSKFSEAELSEQENKLLSKIWSHLKGKHRGSISLINLKTYLSGILNLKLDSMFWTKPTESISPVRFILPQSDSYISRTGQIPTTPSTSTKKPKVSFDSIGTFTTSSKFYFKLESEVRKIHNYYKVLALQRIAYCDFNRGSQSSLNSGSKTKIYYKTYDQNQNKERKKSPMNKDIWRSHMNTYKAPPKIEIEKSTTYRQYSKPRKSDPITIEKFEDDYI